MATFRFSTFVMFFTPLGVLFVMITLKDERYIVIKPDKFTVFEILRDFCTISLEKRFLQSNHNYVVQQYLKFHFT